LSSRGTARPSGRGGSATASLPRQGIVGPG
jgi:hypothetical protein